MEFYIKCTFNTPFNTPHSPRGLFDLHYDLCSDAKAAVMSKSKDSKEETVSRTAESAVKSLTEQVLGGELTPKLMTAGWCHEGGLGCHLG